MSVPALVQPDISDDVAADSIVACHVQGVLQRDYRTWVGFINDHIRDGFSVPKSKNPHLHPSDSTIPCMYCCAHCGELSTVSASLFLSLAERENRGDDWNVERLREPRHIKAAAKTVVISSETLEDVFGPNWVMVLALAYRVEYADAKELVELMLDSRRKYGDILPSIPVGNRDWTLPARWIVASAMLGKQAPSIALREHNRAAAGRLKVLASVVALGEEMDTDTVADWIPVAVDDDLFRSEPKLRIVR